MRQGQIHATREFLDQCLSGPAALLVEGEAGIGKTTFLWGVAESAAARGFRVLSATGAMTEARFAYTAVAELLDGVDTTLFADLPAVQRNAMERVLLLAGDGSPPDERAAAAGFSSILEMLESDAPLLVIVDDGQWLDTSSRVMLGYAVRRFSGRVGILAAFRVGEPRCGQSAAWLKLARPDSTVRLKLHPLTLGSVHALIAEHLGHTLPRPLITRVHEVSGGNPFYALELARMVAADPSRGLVDLPDSLFDLVQHRIGRPSEQLGAVLLAASCSAVPTLERISSATELSVNRVIEIVESVDANGIVELEGNRIRFCHPLFASGVHASASPSQRRAMHRRLADTVEEPEIRARHRALAATTGDPEMLDALDAAAAINATQGAPAAAAELTELAIRLGGDTPLRRIQASEQHFRSGAFRQARNHLHSTIAELPPGSAVRCDALILLAAVMAHDESLDAAVAALTEAVDSAGKPAVRVHARLLLTSVLGMTGQLKAGVEQARAAVADADQVSTGGLRSQALAIWVLVSFMYGMGLDRPALEKALALEDPCVPVAGGFRASAVAAVVTGWAGHLDDAREKMHHVRQRLLHSGTETDIVWAANEAAMIDIYLGRYADAAVHADDGLLRAEQIGGRNLMVALWASRALIAAYTGREDDARAAARTAVDTAKATGAHFRIIAPTTALGLLEVSLGNHSAALAVLEPLVKAFDPEHDTEIILGAYLPDAVEAMTALGRLCDAERLVDALERGGTANNRPWPMAVGARGRCQILSASGDLAAAERAAYDAVRLHQRLPMPFEMARTQLLLGQIQRRRRHRQAAEASLQAAAATFERLGTPLWAKRAEAELARVRAPLSDGIGLTSAERRVAELAASGLSNKEVAAELFIAPKTVEMNLSSAYRKLGIRSRTGLSTALQSSRRKS